MLQLHAHLAALALMAITLAASGCGGSEPSSQTASTAQTASSTQTASPIQTESSTATAPLRRAELIARADAICRRVNAKRATITIRTQQDYARFLPPLASYEQVANTELGKLVPPTSMAGDWRQIVVAARTVADNTAKVGEYAQLNKIGAAQPLFSTTTKVQKRMVATARRDGFKDCALAS